MLHPQRRRLLQNGSRYVYYGNLRQGLVLKGFGQAVADAYYVLSDKTRRKEYDILYASQRPGARTAEPGASSNFFSTFANMFGGTGGPSAQSATGAAAADRPDADHVFADVFEEVRSMTAGHYCYLTSVASHSCSDRRSNAMHRGGRGWAPFVVLASALLLPTFLV